MADETPDVVGKVLRSGYIGEGPKVKEFEQEIQKLLTPTNDLRCANVVATNSATSAEHLALHMIKTDKTLRIGQNEVLATPLTCTATNWPILANGLCIKWVDVDPHTLNMDLDDLARKITIHTKAIMVVHWGGYPIDMERLENIRNEAHDRLGVYPTIIQDCAHALGSKLHGQPITAWGDFATYSFQAIKHLTCGDGGALVTPHKHDYTRAKLLRWYGIDREGDRTDFRCEVDISEWGFKFHMNDISASIGLANLSLLGDTIAKHQDNAAFYNRELSYEAEVMLLDNEEGFDSAYWIYTIRVPRRADFMKMMKDKGIEASAVHARNDTHTCVKQYKALLPTLDVVSKDMVCIPVGWWVTEEDRQYIVDCMKKGW
jgi:dTDP-4-amino-4,6-dideoxygalactose transaminase